MIISTSRSRPNSQKLHWSYQNLHLDTFGEYICLKMDDTEAENLWIELTHGPIPQCAAKSTKHGCKECQLS